MDNGTAPFGQGEDLAVLIEELGDGGIVRVGREDRDGFFTHGGLEIGLDGVRAGVGLAELEEVTKPLTLAEVRRAHALLGAYLAIVDEGRS